TEAAPSVFPWPPSRPRRRSASAVWRPRPARRSTSSCSRGRAHSAPDPAPYVSASLRTVPAARWQPGRVLLAVLAGLSGAPAGQARTAAYFAAPAGRSDGSGGAGHPRDLATPLGRGRGKVPRGVTISLRGGTDAGRRVSRRLGT